MRKKAKQLAFILVTFICSTFIVIYSFIQLIFAVSDLEDPLRKANITEKDLFLDYFGTQISEEKQKAYEKFSGEPFSSDDGIKDQIEGYAVVIVPSLVITGLITSLTNSIFKKRALRRRLTQETHMQEEYLSKYSLPSSAFRVTCIDNLNFSPLMPRQQLRLWFKEGSVHMISFNYRNDIGEVIIKNDSIVFFSRYGDMFTSTNVYEKAPAFSQAFLGCLIGGGVGAILANKGTIASTTRVHDRRETILLVNENGQEKYLFFDPNFYNILIHQIPGKEMSFISKIPQNNSSNSLVEDLIKIGELHEKGHLSKEEFDYLKEEMLKSVG